MHPKTKAEARRMLRGMERCEARADHTARRLDMNDPSRALWISAASQHRAEAARLRALLPALPE